MNLRGSIELAWKDEKAVLVDSLNGDWLVPRLKGKTFLDNDTDDDQCGRLDMQLLRRRPGDI